MKTKGVLRRTLAASVLTLFLLLQSGALFAAPAPPPPPPEPEYLPPAETTDQVYVSLQSLYNEKYVQVINGCGDNIKADRYDADIFVNEIFIMNGSSGLWDGTTVNIRTACSNCYFTASPDGDLDANRAAAAEWETFELVNVTNPWGNLRDGDTIGLKSTHGKYVRVKKDTLGLDARNTVFDQPWEMFKVTFHPEPQELDCQTGLENIHRVGLSFSNTYIVEGEKDGRTVLMLVDTGWGGDKFQIMDAIWSLGYQLCDVKLIYITHAHIDHYGGAEALSLLTGAKIVVHKDDAWAMSWGLSPVGDVTFLPGENAFFDDLLGLFASVPILPTPPDIIVEEGDSLDEYGFTANVIHLPGHTNGSSGLIMYKGNKVVAFPGDLIANFDDEPGVCTEFNENAAQLPMSVDKLQAQKPDWICPGHGENFEGVRIDPL